MAAKFPDWKSKIRKEARDRFLKKVIKPAINDLIKTRAVLVVKMNATSNAALKALYKAEIGRVDAYKAKLTKKSIDSKKLFAARRPKTRR
jgi:hypothetical protein